MSTKVRALYVAAAVVTTPALCAPPVTTQSGAADIAASNRFAGVVNVRDYGAKADGTTDDTAAIQSAVTAAAALVGGRVVLTPTSSGYKMGRITIPASTGLTIDGGGSARVLLTGSDAGFRPVNAATITGLTIQGLEVIGEGVAGRSQSLFQVGDTTGTVTLRDATFRDNRIQDTNIGISTATGASGDVRGVVMDRNHLTNIVGSAGGSGYGLHVGSPSSITAPIGARITSNTIRSAGRHSIYASFGWGVIIENNTILNHGTAADPTAVAIWVGRGGAFIVRGNQVLNTVTGPPDFGTGDEGIGWVGDQGSQYVTVENNQFLGGTPNSVAAYIGTTNPALARPVQYVTFRGNTLQVANGAALLEVVYGKDIDAASNVFVNVVDGSGVQIDAQSEGAGTTTYSDRIRVRDNIFRLTAGSVPMRISAAAATSGARLEFDGNVNATSTADMYVSGGGSSTNPAIFVTRQRTSSLSGQGSAPRWYGPAAVSGDRGDTSQTLVVGMDAPLQHWATALTVNRTVTLSTTGAVNGDTFRIVRTGLGAFTLEVGPGLKVIPSATAAFVDVTFDGTNWVLTGYGTL